MGPHFARYPNVLCISRDYLIVYYNKQPMGYTFLITVERMLYYHADLL